MAYSDVNTLDLGSGRGGLEATLRATLRDLAGVALVGQEDLAGGFLEIGPAGTYRWSYAGFPDDWGGFVTVHTGAWGAGETRLISWYQAPGVTVDGLTVSAFEGFFTRATAEDGASADPNSVVGAIVEGVSGGVGGGDATAANQASIAASLVAMQGPGWTVADTLHAIQLKTSIIPAQPAAINSPMTLTSGERTTLVGMVFAQIVDGGYTLLQVMRGIASAAMGKCSGLLGTNPRYRDLADTKDRINATTDGAGNRSNVIRDLD